MTKRVSIIIIIGLLCLNILSNYFWLKRYETANTEMTTMIHSNQAEISNIHERLSELCKRLTKIEKSQREKSQTDLSFKIVDDEG